MIDAGIEQISLQNCEEGEIDLCQCIKLLAKRKKAFVGVFLFVLGVGLWCFLSSPEIYRISVWLYPLTINEVFSDNNNSKSAKDLKGLIMNNSFNGALRERLNLDSYKNNLEFNAGILDKSNILRVSIDLESKEKEFGVVILQNLAELISESYVKRMEIEGANIARQVKLREYAILNAKEKAKSLQEQIKGITSREDKLNEEKEFITTSTTQDSTYLGRVNNKLGELSLRKERMGLELKNINFQINYFQMGIDKLNKSKDSIPSLRILSQPKVSSTPVGSKKMKTLGLFLVMGVFSGVLAVLLQESWIRKLKKHD